MGSICLSYLKKDFLTRYKYLETYLQAFALRVLWKMFSQCCIVIEYSSTTRGNQHSLQSLMRNYLPVILNHTLQNYWKIMKLLYYYVLSADSNLQPIAKGLINRLSDILLTNKTEELKWLMKNTCLTPEV